MPPTEVGEGNKGKRKGWMAVENRSGGVERYCTGSTVRVLSVVTGTGIVTVMRVVCPRDGGLTRWQCI